MNQPGKKNTKFNTRAPAATRSHIAFRKPGLPPVREEAKLPSWNTAWPHGQVPSQPHTAAQTQTQNPLQPQSAPVPPPAPVENVSGPPLAPSTQIGSVKRVVGIPIKPGRGFPQQTGALNKPTALQAPSPDNCVDNALDEIKEQIQNYLEVCDTLSHRPIEMDYLVEVLFVLARSLNFDFLVFMKAAEGGKSFSHCISRGVRNHPPAFAPAFSPCISDGKIMWNELMKASSEKDAPVSVWVGREKISSIGYVPFQDGDSILGFMILGSYTKKSKTPVASQILELCGGRIGLSLAYESRCKDPDTGVAAALSEVELHHSQALEYFDLLSSSFGAGDGLAGKLLGKSRDSLKKASDRLSEIKSAVSRKKKA